VKVVSSPSIDAPCSTTFLKIVYLAPSISKSPKLSPSQLPGEVPKGEVSII